MTLTIGQSVENVTFGIGTIVEVNGIKVKVNFNGQVKEMLSMTLKAPKAPKVKSYMKEEVIEIDTFKSIVNNLQNPTSMLFFGENIYCKIEKLADSQNHFAGEIIEDARNGKKISEKQACVVAYFAKSNGLINA